MANLWGKLLHWFGWRVDITAPHLDKCIICVAPHTSNWDFPIGLAAYKSLGYKANFLMKQFWFFWPMGILMRKLGGIPVPPKGKGSHLTDHLIDEIRNSSYVNLAVTPEGTRSRQPVWRTGFLRIAYGTNIPIQLGVIDYKIKTVIIRETYHPVGDIDTDMAQVKKYYAAFRDAGKYPDKFTIEVTSHE